MYTYKSSSIVAVVIFLVGLMVIQPLSVMAQTSYSCVIDGGLAADLDSDLMDSEVPDVLRAAISVSNSSSYYMGGVNTALGFYKEEDINVPSFIAVQNDGLLIEPQSSQLITPVIDLSALPAGTYEVRVVAFQGDEVDLLGSLIRGVDDSFTFSKTKSASSDIKHMLTINGEKVSSGGSITISGEANIAATLRTINAGPLPVLDTPVFVSITQGEIPLGSAVRNGVDDVVRLVPGGYRDSVANDLFVEGGKYTVYGFLSSENQANPVISGTVLVGDDVGPNSWVYVAKSGITNFPLTTEDTVTACVEHLGKSEGSTQLLEPVSVTFALSEGEKELFSETAQNITGQPNKYFSVQPSQATDNFELKMTLLTDRFPSAAVPEEGGSLEDNEIEYIEVHSQIGVYECEEDVCISDELVVSKQATQAGDVIAKPYWFYIAVMLAAALLLYIMVRRLHPEGTGAPSDVADEELQ
tara:strand:- start:550 stop:1956 length:1407 start_codon:yes stop_codon:yes gene_type:complete